MRTRARTGRRFEGACGRRRNGSQDGSTSLMAAAQRGHLESARLLVERGASINVASQARPPIILYIYYYTYAHTHTHTHMHACMHFICMHSCMVSMQTSHSHVRPKCIHGSSVNARFNYLPIYLSIYLTTCLSNYLPIYLPIYLSIYLSIYLYNASTASG